MSSSARDYTSSDLNIQAETTNIEDTNFLQNWLEARYDCGFAQMVVDDVAKARQKAQSKQRQSNLAAYDIAANTAINDNYIPRYKRI